MKVEHPKFTNLDKKVLVEKKVEEKVHYVMPPESEDQFLDSMNEVLNNTSSRLEDFKNDPVLSAEDEKRNNLEKLLLFKKSRTKNVKIGGVDFVFKLLNAHENSDVLSKLRALPETESFSKSNVLLVSAAIVSIGGIKLEDTFTGPDSITDPVLKKYYEICKWNMSIINSVVSAYTSFVREADGEYSQDFLNNSEKMPSTD